MQHRHGAEESQVNMIRYQPDLCQTALLQVYHIINNWTAKSVFIVGIFFQSIYLLCAARFILWK